jgi:large subunit ribosomal protein L23
MIDIYGIVKRPIVTERTMALLDDRNTYVFQVHRKANKVQVRNAIEKLFDVKVVSVNTAKVAGKPRRRGRHVYRTSNWKKAFVTLQEGDAIELF